MRHRFPAVLGSLIVTAALCGAPMAAVDVTLDADALNSMLTALAPNQVSVNLAAGRAVTLRMENLHVTSFDPSVTDGSMGHIVTALQLRVPELGVDVPVHPRLSLQVKDAGGKRTCYFRFEKVEVPMPITGSVDIASLLPLLPIHSDQAAWVVAGSRGNVRVQPRLIDAKLGMKNLRLSFDLVIDPVSGAGS
jgi:hypothetical protein